MAVAMWMQSKVCDAIFLRFYDFRIISGLEKVSRREMGFSQELDKNVSNSILGLNGYKNYTDYC